MKQAGDYNQAFTWLVRTTTKETVTGQDVESFTGSSLLWGKMLTDTAVEADAYGSLQSQSTATVQFRQWPAIKATDRLIHRQFNQTYEITGVRKNGPDTIAEMILYDGAGPLGDQ